MGLTPTNVGLLPARSGLVPSRGCGGGNGGIDCGGCPLGTVPLLIQVTQPGLRLGGTVLVPAGLVIVQQDLQPSGIEIPMPAVSSSGTCWFYSPILGSHSRVGCFIIGLGSTVVSGGFNYLLRCRLSYNGTDLAVLMQHFVYRDQTMENEASDQGFGDIFLGTTGVVPSIDCSDFVISSSSTENILTNVCTSTGLSDLIENSGLWSMTKL